MHIENRTKHECLKQQEDRPVRETGTEEPEEEREAGESGRGVFQSRKSQQGQMLLRSE